MTVELIRDRIVVGIAEDSLSDRLQSKASLILARVIQMSHQAESRAQNCDLVRGDNKPAQVEFVKPGKPRNKSHFSRETRKPAQPCAWCGRPKHDRQVCPPKHAFCNKCIKKGHFHNLCRSATFQIKMKEMKQDRMSYSLEKS